MLVNPSDRINSRAYRPAAGGWLRGQKGQAEPTMQEGVPGGRVTGGQERQNKGRPECQPYDAQSSHHVHMAHPPCSGLILTLS